MKRIIFITILLLWAGIAWAGPPSSPPGGNNIPITAVYSGTTSLEESTASDDSGAYIVGAYDNFTNSSSTNVQGVLEDFDTAIGTKAPTDSPALTTQATVDNAFNFRTVLTTAGHEWSIQVYDNTTSTWKDAFQFVNGTEGNYKIILGVPLTGISSINLGEGTLEVPNGTSDFTLSNTGEIGLNETDEQIVVHSGSNGEISGEAAISLLYPRCQSFDPVTVYNTTLHRLMFFEVGPEAPEGVTIDKWTFTFDADPTAEIDIDLKRADAFIGVANAAVVDALDTTNGYSSEDTDANINGGAVVANGQVFYFQIDTAYSEAGHSCTFCMWYHLEED